MASEMTEGSTLVLTGKDVRDLLDLRDAIGAVERAFALGATGDGPPPGVVALHVDQGGFHTKVAALRLGRFYFAAKINGNFPRNPVHRGLPTIQGVIVLSDATDGRPLAILDSIEVTTLRTGAATAVAAKHLARPESSVVTIVGCGVQGRMQLLALAAVLPVERAFAVDTDEGTAARFADEMTATLGVPVTVSELSRATHQSDVCVTCTPSTRAFLRTDHLRRGAFVAAVGADHPEKQEIDPDLFKTATIVVDSSVQCREFGELGHAIAAGTVPAGAVVAELGEVLARSKAGRSSLPEVVIFDSTGIALQDVAVAALVYERAIAAGRGCPVTLPVNETPEPGSRRQA